MATARPISNPGWNLGSSFKFNDRVSDPAAFEFWAAVHPSIKSEMLRNFNCLSATTCRCPEAHSKRARAISNEDRLAADPHVGLDARLPACQWSWESFQVVRSQIAASTRAFCPGSNGDERGCRMLK